jgi:hypothetical protein
LLLAVGSGRAQPVDLRSGPQLFIDDYLIAESSNVATVTQSPKRALDGPVIGWKEHTTQPYVTVLRDPSSGKFRMWYNYDTGTRASIAYAESDDGVKWTLPVLNILGPDNRLFIIGRSSEHGSYGLSVIDDGARESNPSKRYKIMWWSGTTEPAGAAVAFSPDGLRWTPYEKNPVLPHYDTSDPRAAIGVGDIVDAFYDPIRQRYGALVKLHGVKEDGWAPGPRAGSAFRRIIGASHSSDFMNWAEPWRVITPEPRDDGLLEFYSAGGTFARGPLLISFVRMLHDDYSPEPGVLDDRGVTPGIGYTVLATSRDGVKWQRHDDIFFDRNPTPGTWDRAMSWIGSAVQVGDELYLYYGGYARGHKIEPTKERQIGMVKMPVDRFVARQARGAVGNLRTVSLKLTAGPSSTLVINADASGGRVRAQLRDSGGKVIPGYSFNEVSPVTGNDHALPLKWKSDLSTLDGKTLCIEFELTNAKLFAFDLKN